MATSNSAKKRIRQNEKRRLRNQSAEREIKTLTKKLAGLVSEKGASGENKAAAQALYRSIVARLDRAGRKRVLHPNAAARRKSHLSRLVASLGI